MDRISEKIIEILSQRELSNLPKNSFEDFIAPLTVGVCEIVASCGIILDEKTICSEVSDYFSSPIVDNERLEKLKCQ